MQNELKPEIGDSIELKESKIVEKDGKTFKSELKSRRDEDGIIIEEWEDTEIIIKKQ